MYLFYSRIKSNIIPNWNMEYINNIYKYLILHNNYSKLLKVGNNISKYLIIRKVKTLKNFPNWCNVVLLLKLKSTPIKTL